MPRQRSDHLADDLIDQLLPAPAGGGRRGCHGTRRSRGARRGGAGALYRMGRELAASGQRIGHLPGGRGLPPRPWTGDPDDADARPSSSVLQRALSRLVLSAAAGVSELRPRGGAVSVRGGAAAREPQSPADGTDRPAVSAAPADCGRRFRGPGFSFGSTGALRRPEVFAFLVCGAPARLRGGDEAKNAVPQTACGVPPCRWRPRAERGPCARPLARLTDVRYAAPHLGPRAPGGEARRSRPPRADRSRGTTSRLRGTNRRVQTPRFIWRRSTVLARDIENRIKRICSFPGCQIDRTSCCLFWANQCASS